MRHWTRYKNASSDCLNLMTKIFYIQDLAKESGLGVGTIDPNFEAGLIR